jgi:hypothetical protein
MHAWSQAGLICLDVFYVCPTEATEENKTKKLTDKRRSHVIRTCEGGEKRDRSPRRAIRRAWPTLRFTSLLGRIGKAGPPSGHSSTRLDWERRGTAG